MHFMRVECVRLIYKKVDSLMKKLFIITPMTGYSKEEIKEIQDIICQIISSQLGEKLELIQNFPPFKVSMSALECLGENIKNMSNADYIAFAPGYEGSRVCLIEKLCAECYMRGEKFFFPVTKENDDEQ